MALNSHTNLLHPLSHDNGQMHHDAGSNERPPESLNSTEPPQASRKRDLFLVFAILFVPLLAIALILLAFVFFRSQQVRFLLNGTPELPTNSTPSPSPTSYYTTQSVGAFTLLGSWASSAAQFVLAPFMILFSFYVAREMTSSEINEADNEEVARTLEKLTGGEWAGMWHWVSYMLHSTRIGQRQTDTRSRAVLVAGLGLLFAGLFSLLIVAGDTWLHLAVQSKTIRMYENITYPLRNPPNESDVYAAGWTTIPACDSTLTSPLPLNVSQAPPPCSLINKKGVYNIANPNTTYIALAEGITPEPSSYILNSDNVANIRDVDVQIVTHRDNVTGISHSFLYWPYAAYEYDPIWPNTTNYGIDYTANTTSLVTNCTSVTKTCLSQSIPINQTILSIPFNCSADFSGDLGQPPANGLERVQGWDTGFYDMVDGIPSNFPFQAQFNPFTFFAVAAVNSISFADFNSLSNSEAGDGSVIDAGNGRVAFALSCEATVYDVQYSLVAGNITSFNATPSSARKASIIKAPLQVGFGRYNLYQSALLSVIQTDSSIPDYMSSAISPIGMALASGAFTFTNNFQQRFRYDLTVTEVPKGPLWFLVTVCLIYTIMSIAALIAAMVLRRNEKVAMHHAELLPRYPFRIRLLLKNFWGLLVDGKISRRKGKNKKKKTDGEELRECGEYNRNSGSDDDMS